MRALYHSRDQSTDEFQSFSRLAQYYELEFETGWLIELQKELLAEGIITGPSNGYVDKQAIGRLTWKGLREAKVLVDELAARGTILIGAHGALAPEVTKRSSFAMFWRRNINWTKWGAISAALAIPTMILL